MIAPLSLSIADHTVTVTDGNGNTYTARDATVEAGDVLGVETSRDGSWFTAVRDGVQVHRLPLRHGDGPHFTELEAITTWPNPLLPPAGTDETAAP